MSKPKEFYIHPGKGICVPASQNSIGSGFIHVVEKSVYDRLLKAAENISGTFLGYEQIEACWDCTMNFSQHDKHDPGCAVLALHEILKELNERN